MITIQLTAVMDKIAHNTYFLGVLLCSYLPKTLLKNLPAMLIFNTDPSTEPERGSKIFAWQGQLPLDLPPPSAPASGSCHRYVHLPHDQPQPNAPATRTSHSQTRQPHNQPQPNAPATRPATAKRTSHTNQPQLNAPATRTSHSQTRQSHEPVTRISHS